MKQILHPYHGPHGRRHEDASVPGDRETLLDSVAWAALFIWVGAAWLAGLELGYILLGIGLLVLAMQGARRLARLGLETLWVLVGCGFFAAGYWELWNIGVPLAPIVLIAAGISLLAWQFLARRG